MREKLSEVAMHAPITYTTLLLLKYILGITVAAAIAQSQCQIENRHIGLGGGRGREKQ